MPPLVTLESLIRYVPPHRLVTGNRSLRLPSALCLMGRLRSVPLRHAMQASHDAGAVFNQPRSARRLGWPEARCSQGIETEVTSDPTQA